MNTTEFEKASRALAVYLASAFSAANISRLDFTLCIEGRPDGDLKISYGLGEYGSEVKGDFILAVLDEFLRRKGWSDRHNPLCLKVNH